MKIFQTKNPSLLTFNGKIHFKKKNVYIWFIVQIS